MLGDLKIAIAQVNPVLGNIPHNLNLVNKALERCMDADLVVFPELAAGGYPDAPETGKAIQGIDAASEIPGSIVFHAGTATREGRLVTAGGRVLTVVGRGTTYGDAIDAAYAAASRIHFEGMQYRRDIGRKALSV